MTFGAESKNLDTTQKVAQRFGKPTRYGTHFEHFVRDPYGAFYKRNTR
jgi:hypothetical protein